MKRLALSPSEIALAREITGDRPPLGRRHINAHQAVALYNMFRCWRLVAQAMPGKFQPDSIAKAVHDYDKGKLK